MRSYRDRAPYVRARFEAAGVELDGIELAGGDFSDMHGYGDRFFVPAGVDAYPMPGVGLTTAVRPTTVVVFTVPRIEPHQNPPWWMPAEGFV